MEVKNIEFIEIKDYPTRYKYLDMVLKLTGGYHKSNSEKTSKQLDSIGVTDEYLNQKLQEGLEAKGECYGTRKQYLDTALKLGYSVSKELQKEILDLRKSKFNGLERFFDNITPDNIRYVGDRKLFIRTKKTIRNPDFIVDGQKKVIEIFGDYWHKGENPEDKIKEYGDVGYKCLVFWESEVYNKTIEVLEKVNNFLKENIIG